MPAYTYTTNQLVSDAYKLISVIDENDTLEGVQLQSGINIVNQILSADEQAGNSVPYYKTVPFELVIGSQVYEFALTPSGGNPMPSASEPPVFIESNPIVSVENMQLLINQTRVPIIARDRDQFLNTMRYNEATGQSQEFLFQRDINTSFIVMWPNPSSNWTVEVSCKLMFNFITPNSNLPTIPSYYYRYLKYALAQELAASYNDAMWTQRHQSTFDMLTNLVKSTNDTDYSIIPSNALMGMRWYPIVNNLVLP